MVSVRCTGAALGRSTGILQPHYFLVFLCSQGINLYTLNKKYLKEYEHEEIDRSMRLNNGL